MGTLFLIGRALKTDTALAAAEGLAERGEDVHLLFILRGVENAENSALIGRLGFAKSVSCLDDGNVKDVAEGVEVVDYSGWVRLIEACERIVSWT